MDEITLDEKTYVSSKRAAQITGYAKDYVGQLCREGRVEARLVGRNWYVLESSLREHRFGSETPKKVNLSQSNSESGTEQEWKPSKYVSESSDSLPEFLNNDEKGLNYPEYSIPIGHIAESDVVKEMQNAWQDWFAKKSVEKQTQEEFLESSEPIDEREMQQKEGYGGFGSESEANSTDENEFESETEPIILHNLDAEDEIEPQEREPEAETIHITKVTEPKLEVRARSNENSYFDQQNGAEIEEVVPVHRTYVPPVTVTPPSYRRQSYTNYPAYAPEGRVIRERRIKSKKKPSGALSALFISCAIIAIAIAIIASGKFNAQLNLGNVHYAPILFLEGENSVLKASK